MIFLVNNPDTSLGIGDIIRKSLDTFMDDNVNTGYPPKFSSIS